MLSAIVIAALIIITWLLYRNLQVAIEIKLALHRSRVEHWIPFRFDAIEERIAIIKERAAQAEALSEQWTARYGGKTLDEEDEREAAALAKECNSAASSAERERTLLDEMIEANAKVALGYERCGAASGRVLAAHLKRIQDDFYPAESADVDAPHR